MIIHQEVQNHKTSGFLTESKIPVDFLVTQTEYQSSLSLEYKKSNGVFYTDLTLARLIVDDLQVEQNTTVMDPCCGLGSFLLALSEKGVRNIYGIDIDAEAVEKSKVYHPQAKVIECDSISNSGQHSLECLGLSHPVDVVVGNPPYAPLTGRNKIHSIDQQFTRKVREYGNNLFVAALLRAFELVKGGGLISYIIPKNFLHVSSYKKFREEILRTKTILSITDVGAYFKNVRGEQIILMIKNAPPHNNQIRVRKLENQRLVDKTFVEQQFFTDEIILFENNLDLKIYQHLISTFPLLGNIQNNRIYRGKSKDKGALTGKEIIKFGYKRDDLIPHGNKVFIQNIYSSESGIIATLGNTTNVSETVTVIEVQNENFGRYLLGILHSKVCNFFLYKFCYNQSKLTMHTDAIYLQKIPLPVTNEDTFYKIVELVKLLERTEYRSKKWMELITILDELVVKSYHLESVAGYIHSEMKKIQSKKWN